MGICTRTIANDKRAMKRKRMQRRPPTQTDEVFTKKVDFVRGDNEEVAIHTIGRHTILS